MFFCTHLSDNIPPRITPIKEDTAMVMVDMGPACAISIDRFDENRVGSQFLVAQPGKLGVAKYNKITQNHTFAASIVSPLNMGILSVGFSVFMGCSTVFLSLRKRINIMLYITPMTPNQ